jgi:2-C-methyl-D-erythritol 4-phosphate cytidylyltransferase
MNYAVLLAGGKGERIKSAGVPKQFINVGGKPLFSYALDAIGQCADFDVICVVTFPDRHYDIHEFAAQYLKPIIFAEPGISRQHSVLNGLEAIENSFPTRSGDKVVVHDAARPFASKADVEACIAACNGFDGATPAITPADTIYLSDDGKTIGQLLDRDKLFAGQTPECYNFQKYLAAFRRLSDDELLKIRGGSELAYRAGMNICLYPGNPDNLKITTDRDLQFFKFIKNEG